MVALPYALSVNHLVSTVGADAGLAAIVGLAVLVLLYFAQARETAALRDQVADCTDQVQELERRLAALARASSAASAPATAAPASHAPAPPPPGLNRPVVGAARMGAGAPVASRASNPVPVPVPVPVPAGAPSAPAGVGAPALSAATRLIPAPDRHRFAVSAGAANSPGVADRAAAADRASAADRAAAANPVGAAVLDPPAPRPATAAGGANGSAARAAPPRRSALPPSRPPGRAPGASSGGSRRSRPLLAALVLLAVIIVAVVLLVVRSGGSTPQSSATSRSASSAASAGTTRPYGTRVAGAIAPASVTVAVLNGTSVAHLAHKVALQLGQVGFKQGNVATAANQTMTTTVVGYLPGQRPAALLVAKQLKLGSASVGPVDQSNQTVACPASSTPCTAKVVVTVGSDRASTP